MTDIPLSFQRVDATHSDLTNRYSSIRVVLGVVAGWIAGVLTTNSLQVGAQYSVDDAEFFGWLLWGDHWLIRAAATLASTGIAAFLGGMVARRRGNLVGVLTVLPASLVWVMVALMGWGVPVLGSLTYTEYIPIGYRISGLILPFGMIPLAKYAADEGAQYGEQWSERFDRRRGTLLGVKWFHFFWVPIVIHLCVAQSFFAGLYGFEWVKMQWRAMDSLFSIVPLVFGFAVYYSLKLMWSGLYSAYESLSRMKVESGRAIAVLKYSIGYPSLAVAIQALVIGVHYGLLSLFGKT